MHDIRTVHCALFSLIPCKLSRKMTFLFFTVRLLTPDIIVWLLFKLTGWSFFFKDIFLFPPLFIYLFFSVPHFKKNKLSGYAKS